MSSRANILSAVFANQPAPSPLPPAEHFVQPFTDAVVEFKKVLQAIGGEAEEVDGMAGAMAFIRRRFAGFERIVSTDDRIVDDRIVLVSDPAGTTSAAPPGLPASPHVFANVDIVIIPAHFAVAENGAVWVTESLLRERVLPFICQQLVAIVNRADVLSSMQEAYDAIERSEYGFDYGFGSFIAGPSKTADIEQSLVRGAHGPKTMTVLIINTR
jgi:L-lactate dehydrogenase complex protein LldG